MSKKLIIVSSSPRKGGNSDTLCDEFMRGAKEAGNIVEKIFLKDWDINYCKGCGACFSTGKCVQKDDMEKLIGSMIEADVIVMATPVYFYTMCGQMKTFIDRLCPNYSALSGKDYYYIATAADDNQKTLERTIDGFRGYTDCLNSYNEKGVIYATGVWKTGEVNAKPFMKQAYEMGKTI